MSDHRQQLPILYSFRRCPYAMRARLAMKVAGVQCELREVLLRDKPAEMLAVSPKGTVPVLIDSHGTVIDESLALMLWALGQSDPEAWLQPETGSLDEILSLIETFEQRFKPELDRYKYPNRYGDLDPIAHRAAGSVYLFDLDEKLTEHQYLFGSRRCLADMALMPFVRQFAHVDKDWFESQGWTRLVAWLDGILESELFDSIMRKYPQWTAGQPGERFPSDA